MALHYLFLDFNSYFASVEQHVSPELRGRPVGVVPVEAETSCCIAASYEAKAFGVKTGTAVWRARQLCPGIRLVKARPALYVEYHHRLVEAVGQCVLVEKVCSIDEMYCELTGSQRPPAAARELALEIKRTIAERVGTTLRSSIGIAPNAFLAKTASDMQKPDGLTMLDLDDLPEALYGLKLDDLCGIGPAMLRRLYRSSIYTVRDLYACSLRDLRRIWGGIEGERMFLRLRGESVPLPPTRRSTVGHSHVLPPKRRTEEDARAVLNKLVQKAAMRMRSYGYAATLLAVRVAYINGAAWADSMKCTPTSDTAVLLGVFERLWSRKPDPGGAIPLQVLVNMPELRPQEALPETLFPAGQNRDKLHQSLDLLCLRYGRSAVYYAGAHTAQTAAPMRISFTHIPDLETEGDDARRPPRKARPLPPPVPEYLDW